MTRFALLPLLALAACGSGADTPAEKLEAAAEQSDPAAAAVLENAADSIAVENQAASVGTPDSAAQQAMQHAGNAQAATLPSRSQSGLDPAIGAKPHAPGDPVSPPQTTGQPH